MLTRLNKAPFPWFGGKSRAAPLVWQLLGDPCHYVEPFAGALGVLLERPHPCNRAYYSETVNDLDGLLCLAPETRILMHDLTWKSIGDILPGEKMWGFDEHQKKKVGGGLGAPDQYRKWHVATCTASNRVKKNCYRLTFSDGTKVIASEDHLWLGGGRNRGYRWISTKGMICNRKEQRSHVIKLCHVTEKNNTWGAGWLAGFFDGEGHLTGNFGWALGACQAIGTTLNRAKSLLTEHGFSFRVEEVSLREAHHKPKENIWLQGGMRETLRFLMTMRPERLVPKAMSIMPNKSIYARERQTVGLVSKEFLGEMEVVALETDTHTFVAEGLASHNCNAWRGIQWHPDEVAEAASWPVSEADKQARQIACIRWRTENLDLLAGSAEWCDPKMAGWWLYSVCCQIGAFAYNGPWMADPETGRITKMGRPGVSRKLPHLGNDGVGINRPQMREPGVSRQLPHLSSNGQGINHPGIREMGVIEEMSDEFHPRTMPELRRWMAWLSARLRHVRIVNGDWQRVCTSGVLKTLNVRQKEGVAGVFLDPPYDLGERTKNLYGHDTAGIADDVREWCLRNGDDPEYRIVLAGFDTEHQSLESHGWIAHEWFKNGFLAGGYGDQAHRERLWSSPHCLTICEEVPAQHDLFFTAETIKK
jgi:hypothetical protein